VAKAQDTDTSLTNVWAVTLGVFVSTMPRALSLCSLFLTWVCFSPVFNTIFHAFLTTFLDSPYKTPIQITVELFASSVKFAYPSGHNFIFENGDEMELSKVQSNRVNCPSYEECVNWAKYQKYVSILLLDKVADINYARGVLVGENSEPLECSLEDGIVFNTGLTIIMLFEGSMICRVNEFIDRVVEAVLYNYWRFLSMHHHKLISPNISIVHPLDGYYTFNLYHMQPALYILLMGWCLSALCFLVELLCNRVLSKNA